VNEEASAMSSCVADLDGILQSMLLLKAPGVTGSKITSITALCNENIQVSLPNVDLRGAPQPSNQPLTMTVLHSPSQS
jgi:hypothetical protein